jgi:hypothetical protein
MGKPVIFSGGGYFRLFPYSLIKKWTKDADYIMTYFHPRDFDYNQPVIKDLSSLRRFKSYVGLKSCKPKLIKWLNDFEFIDLTIAANKVDWNNADIVVLD